jgi:5-methylcytosine-specific restriction protein A
MTGLPRTCLGCGTRIPSGSRCTRCATKVQRVKRAVRPYTAAEKARRAAAVEQWRATHGDTCPGWGDREPHAVVAPNILTADHVVPYAAGGSDDGPLSVLCRSCNGAKGARP